MKYKSPRVFLMKYYLYLETKIVLPGFDKKFKKCLSVITFNLFVCDKNKSKEGLRKKYIC